MNNHSRNLSNEGFRFNNQLSKEKQKATAKQKKFYIALTYKCKEHNIEYNREPCGRMEFSMAIDDMITKLREAGVDIRAKQDPNFVNAIEVREATSTLQQNEVEAKIRYIKQD